MVRRRRIEPDAPPHDYPRPAAGKVPVFGEYDGWMQALAVRRAHKIIGDISSNHSDLRRELEVNVTVDEIVSIAARAGAQLYVPNADTLAVKPDGTFLLGADGFRKIIENLYWAANQQSSRPAPDVPPEAKCGLPPQRSVLDDMEDKSAPALRHIRPELLQEFLKTQDHQGVEKSWKMATAQFPKHRITREKVETAIIGAFGSLLDRGAPPKSPRK